MKLTPATQKPRKFNTATCAMCGQEFQRQLTPASMPKTCSAECLGRLRMGIRYVKYHISPEVSSHLKKLYEAGLGGIRKYAKKIGIPRQILYLHARERGYIKREYPPGQDRYWSEAEKELVLKMGDYHPLTVARHLQKLGYNRTVAGVVRCRTIMRAGQNRNGMSASEAALCLGLDMHAVLRLINVGKIKAVRRPGYCEAGRMDWHITAAAMRKYILNNLPEVDFRKIDKYWLVDLLTNGPKKEAPAHGYQNKQTHSAESAPSNPGGAARCNNAVPVAVSPCIAGASPSPKGSCGWQQTANAL